MTDTISPATSRHVEQDVIMQDLLRASEFYNQDSVLPLFEAIQSQQNRVSAIQQISPNYPLTLGDNLVMSPVQSTAYVTGENNPKIVSPGQNMAANSIKPFKIVSGIQYCMEDEIRGGEALARNIINSLASSIAKQIDVAGILGRQLSSGEVLENNKINSVAANSIRLNITEGTPADVALIEAAQEITSKGFTPDGVIGTPELQSALFAQRSKDGSRLYGDGTVLGGNVGQIIGLPKTVITQNLSGTGVNGQTVNPDRILGVVGDFSQIVFGTVDIADWAYRRFTVGDPFMFGYDLANRNQVALRLEMIVGVGVVNPDAFVTIAAPGTPHAAPKGKK